MVYHYTHILTHFTTYWGVLDIAGQLHIYTHNSCDSMYKTWVNKPDKILA